MNYLLFSGDKKEIIDNLADSLLLFLFDNKKGVEFYTAVDSITETSVLHFPPKKGLSSLRVVILKHFYWFLEIVSDINKRLERRTNAEWKHMRDVWRAARMVSTPDTIIPVISPVKSKRGPDKKSRAARIKPTCDFPGQNTHQFDRASTNLFSALECQSILMSCL
jgi:hypothetical protein